ncbi:uncharacterized protein MKZ38_002694 [Zalerion maritima]|uniref:Fucose-specific lectin n=1 Tax=Zalerion maritima TaxID=339359 RepID=A0AAD5WS97_9PEZI|nr:uncharacterized protein MKZ38_002694 [Zalerion maritima]
MTKGFCREIVLVVGSKEHGMEFGVDIFSLLLCHLAGSAASFSSSFENSCTSQTLAAFRPYRLYASSASSSGAMVALIVASQTSSVYPETGLDAIFQECDSDACINGITVVYQDSKQVLKMVSGSDMAATYNVWQGVTAKSAIFLCMPGADKNFPRVFADQSNTVQELAWGDGGARVGGICLHDQPTYQVGGASYGADRAQNRVFIGALNESGMVSALYWNEVSWTIGAAPEISDWGDSGNYNFVSVSMNDNMMFYDLTDDGTIHQFLVDRSVPSSWSYQGEVTVPTK